MSNEALNAVNARERAGADERTGKLYMFVAMVISGTIGYFVTQSGQTPFNVVLFRCSIGAIGLSGWCLTRGYFSSIHLDRGSWVKLILGALTLVANWCFLFTAYRLTSIGITTVVYNVQPFLLLIGGFVIQREVPSRSAVAWLLLSFTGLLILASPGAAHDGTRYMDGIGCALAAATLYAATTLFTRSLAATLRPEVIAVGHMFVGTAVFLPLANFHALPSSGSEVGAILALGLVHTTFMYVLLYGAFQRAKTSSIAVLSFVYPLVAVTVDFLAYGKTLSMLQLGGAILIVAAASAYASGRSMKELVKLARRPVVDASSLTEERKSGPK